MEVDADGRVKKVVLDGLPQSAEDFFACTRASLGDMSIPSSVLKLRLGDLIGSTNGAAALRTNELGNVFILGVFVLLGELAVEYGGYSILFTISVGLAATAVRETTGPLTDPKDIRRECNDRRTDCLESGIASFPGPKRGHSRCEGCYDVCMQDDGVWPTLIELGGQMVGCK